MKPIVLKLIAGTVAVLVGLCLALLIRATLAGGALALFRSIAGTGWASLLVIPAAAFLTAVALIVVVVSVPMTHEGRQRIKAIALTLIGSSVVTYFLIALLSLSRGGTAGLAAIPVVVQAAVILFIYSVSRDYRGE